MPPLATTADDALFALPPILEAALGDRWDVVHLLLESGASPNEAVPGPRDVVWPSGVPGGTSALSVTRRRADEGSEEAACALRQMEEFLNKEKERLLALIPAFLLRDKA